MNKEEMIAHLTKNPPHIFEDDTPDIIHGVNCNCEDSCLDMICDKCGNEMSRSRISECCGQMMRIW